MEIKKKRSGTSLIACDHCRKMKVKCDGVLPCARCSKNSLLCSFSSGKKKPSLSNEEKSNGNQVGFTLNPKESALFTSQVVNFLLDFHFFKLSQFFNEPESNMRQYFPFDSLQGKLQMYSLLSLHFRGDGNLEAAEKFLKYGLQLSKEVFDDCQSETTVHSAFGLSSLASALSIVDSKKAHHYVTMSNSLLKNCQPTNEKYRALKFLVEKSNSALMGIHLLPDFTLIQNFVEDKITLNDLVEIRNQKVENSDHLQPLVVTKIGVVESFFLIRGVVFYFAPLMSETGWEINEESFKIPTEVTKDCILMCLQFIEKIEAIVRQNIPFDSSFTELDISYYKGIFYRWIGEQEKAIEAWKGNIRFLLNSSTMTGITDDPIIQTASSVLARFSLNYPLANDALVYLENYKRIMKTKIQEIYPQNLDDIKPDIKPNIKFTQEYCDIKLNQENLCNIKKPDQEEDWILSPSNFSSTEPSNSQTPDFLDEDEISNNFEDKILLDFLDPFTDLNNTSFDAILETNQNYNLYDN